MGEAIIISRDAGLVEQVQGAAAAVRAAVLAVRDPEQVRQVWRSAGAVFIGVESAPWCAGLGLPSRRGTYVVGREAAEVSAWSVPLEAAVILLPEQSGFVSAVVDAGRQDEGGVVIRVVGASGGLGTSTLAAGLAQVASRQGAAALVEVARCGGGLDVMMGVERVAGWRWDDLRGASGHLGEVATRLPQCDRVAVLALGRGGHEPTPESATAVVRALGRTHPVVVIDTGRGESAVAEHWSQTRTLLVVGADVRGVLAARALVEQRGWHDLDLVVRRGPGRGLSADEVADSLGLPLAGILDHHRRLPRELAQGLAPASARTRFARQCQHLLQQVRP